MTDGLYRGGSVWKGGPLILPDGPLVLSDVLPTDTINQTRAGKDFNTISVLPSSKDSRNKKWIGTHFGQDGRLVHLGDDEAEITPLRGIKRQLIIKYSTFVK